MDATLLHQLPLAAAERRPEAVALTHGSAQLRYRELAQKVQAVAAGLRQAGLQRADRVAIYLESRPELVAAAFGAAAAGAVFVPVNPLLKAAQLRHILADSGARVLVTSAARLAAALPLLQGLSELQQVWLVDEPPAPPAMPSMPPMPPGLALRPWAQALDAAPLAGHRVLDADMAAILYTSGSTGAPKGVVLSHRNLVLGARSVASYLGNHEDDHLLAVLPLSFDAGFSQLTTGFHAGARVVLLNHLLPRDVLRAIERERITGLTAVPPLYIQLAQLDWPQGLDAHLRYFANTGGRMPRETLKALRQRLPRSRPFLMYGLTEAFRSTYLPPEEVDQRPDSIGRAIPNVEVLVLDEHGRECAPGQPGELVHRGPLVGLGYWRDAQRTAERYRPLPPGLAARPEGLPLPELAVYSGDTVRRDADGFLYFIGRRDEMIKTSGYRVSPTEVEELLYASGLVGECVAFGVDHPQLGQAIQVVATPPAGAADLDVPALLAHCRRQMPAYMLPQAVSLRPAPLPRNANGKLDRPRLKAEHEAAQAALPAAAHAAEGGA